MRTNNKNEKRSWLIDIFYKTRLLKLKIEQGRKKTCKGIMHSQYKWYNIF